MPFQKGYEQLILINGFKKTSYWCVASSCFLKTAEFASFQLSFMSRTHHNLP